MTFRSRLRAVVRAGGSLGMGIALLWAAAAPCEGQVFAQVLPTREVITARPGLPVVRQVVVTNRGEGPVVVRPRLADWVLDERGEMVIHPAGTVPGSLAGCLRFEPAVFSLPPGESGRVELTMELPPDGLPTRWGVLLCEVRSAAPRPASFGPRAIAELGTTLYLSSVSPERIASEVVGVRAAGGDREPIVLGVRLRNNGERQFHIGGGFALADSSGAIVRSGPLPTGVILPGYERELTWTCDQPLPPGSYRAIATLDTGQPELLVAESWVQLPGAPSRPSLAARP